jgi:hypothetical protein
MNGSILSVTGEQWQQAQKDELHYWSTQGPDGDDWNAWWAEQFNNYEFLRRHHPNDYIEVGCGPYAGNTKRILKVCPSIKTVVLQDPLMPEFQAQGKASTKMPGMWSGGKLETFKWAFRFDTMVCINVLDHVHDVAACFRTMDDHLYSGGMLIIGQDLTSEFDMANCPEMRNDQMHPIKMDLESLAPFIFPHYQTKFLKILPRQMGRNPKAHYATLLWAGTKI